MSSYIIQGNFSETSRPLCHMKDYMVHGEEQSGSKYLLEMASSHAKLGLKSLPQKRNC